eukprot:364588-Chlamydomonas_euryale.AAC.6
MKSLGGKRVGCASVRARSALGLVRRAATPMLRIARAWQVWLDAHTCSPFFEMVELRSGTGTRRMPRGKHAGRMRCRHTRRQRTVQASSGQTVAGNMRSCGQLA